MRRIFSWGSSSTGQLGHGDLLDLSTPREINTLQRGHNEIINITGGGSFSLAIVQGQLFSWGNGEKGELGSGNEKSVSQPTHLPPFSQSPITHVSAGWDHALALSEAGTVYSWGSTQFGPCFEKTSKQQLKQVSPKAIMEKEMSSKAISAGFRHSAAVSQQGKAFIWGEGKFGQLGLSNTATVLTPTLIPNLDNVKQICCGWKHTIALLDDGSVVAFGDNKYGQLGNDQIKRSEQPIEISHLKNADIIAIATGWSHCMAVSRDGKLYGWGRGNYGQLGQNTTKDSCVPLVIQLPQTSHENQRVIQVVCGSEHSLALSQEGKAYGWGWNEHGQCGVGSLTDILSPTLIQEGVITIGSGSGHSFSVVGQSPDLKS